MNYRHHFHAGNFADVVKHALLGDLLRGLQNKDRGFLYLDTHAGRGAYVLEEASRGDSLERLPEWPEGIGRLWGVEDLPASLARYRDTVRRFSLHRSGRPLHSDLPPQHYPGSPLFAAAFLREQDRQALFELEPGEFAELRRQVRNLPRASVQELDGYTSLRACLPPPERRALVLVDPPYEQADEFERIIEALPVSFQRCPGATLVVWYPLTQRARIDAFFETLGTLHLPPAWTAELWVAGEEASLRLRGCGLLVFNPPWRLEREVEGWLPRLAELLAQGPGAGARLSWVVPE